MLPGFYRICYLVLKALFKLVTRWRVRGRENVPNEGPLLIVANHLNLADPPLLGVRAFSGSALIALRRGVPILPVGISGTEKIKGITWLLRRPQVMVNIGYPFHPPPVKGESRKAERAEFTNSIMRHIAELLPPEYRGNHAGQGD